MASTSGMSCILHGGSAVVYSGYLCMKIICSAHLYNVQVQYADSESTDGKKWDQIGSWDPAQHREESEALQESKHDWEILQFRLKNTNREEYSPYPGGLDLTFTCIFSPSGRLNAYLRFDIFGRFRKAKYLQSLNNGEGHRVSDKS